MSHRWLLILALLSGPVLAGWQEALPQAHVVGAAEFRVFGFRVYTARLWSVGKPFTPEQPLAVELTYHRDISRDDLVDASIDEIKRTSPEGVSDSQLQSWRAEMAKAFVDVTAGMKIIGVYLPGREARFYVGEKLQHVVQDPAFAKAFFNIWLSPKTRDPELREQLMGRVAK